MVRFLELVPLIELLIETENQRKNFVKANRRHLNQIMKLAVAFVLF